MTKPRSDTPKSFRFSEEELALLDRVAAQNGGPKKAVIAGLLALDAGTHITKAEVLRWIRERT
jgi:predicted transcriptional regulator